MTHLNEHIKTGNRFVQNIIGNLLSRAPSQSTFS